jgi:outer membrane protein assembly factor BamA
VPEFGYGPDTGFEFGGKVTDRDLAGTGITLDVDALFSLRQYQRFGLSIGSPHLGGDRFVVLLNADYLKDPQREFFGLGNNDVGPDPLSTNLYERIEGLVHVGWRPVPRLALDLGIGLRHVHIGTGNRMDETPFTVHAFPGLPGVQGGYVLPLEASLVWNTRDGVVHPTQGWRVIAKVSHTNPVLQSPFRFTRYFADVSYLIPFHDGAQVLGLRANGAFIAGAPGHVPFWEMEEIGGDDTLQGFFPRRFLGTGRGLLNAEYRFRLGGFTFFRLWYLQIDGALFGGVGRVFLDHDDYQGRFAPSSPGGSASLAVLGSGSRSPRRSWHGSTWALATRRPGSSISPSGNTF